MKIEMLELEYLTLFGNTGDILERAFTLNEVKYQCVQWDHAMGDGWNPAKITLTLVKPFKLKSPQELSAEESVKKAEEALRAAKEVLNKVKEK